jgi:hypothetical protein
MTCGRLIKGKEAGKKRPEKKRPGIAVAPQCRAVSFKFTRPLSAGRRQTSQSGALDRGCRGGNLTFDVCTNDSGKIFATSHRAGELHLTKHIGDACRMFHVHYPHFFYSLTQFHILCTMNN